MKKTRLRFLVLASALLLSSSMAPGAKIGGVRKAVINVTGVIIPYQGKDLANDGDNRMTELHTVVGELKAAIKFGIKDITIKLNTPGGVINEDSSELAAIIRAHSGSDVHIACLVDGTAYSLGAYILSQCDTRLATAGSSVMWHSAAFHAPEGFRINQKVAEEILEHMIQLNAFLWTRLHSLIPEEYFIKHFEAETLIPVEQLVKEVPGFIIIVK